MTEKAQPSSNIFLFHGEDNFSLQRKVDHWKTEFAKKYSPNAITVIEAENSGEVEIIKSLQTHLSPSLFASKKLIIVRDGLPSKATQTQLAEFLLNTLDNIPKDFFVIFWQSSKPDGRLGFTKKFIAKVVVTEFELPHGLILNQWIKAMTKTLGANITDRGADKLALFLGRDLFEEKKIGGRVIERREAYDLWQVYSELLKLTSLNNQIDIAEVENLVKPKIPDSVFSLTDQVIARNQKGAFQAFENFLTNQTVEEKTSLIKIIALLSEQLRSLLVVSLLANEGMDNDQIADKLGWTSGRVFITARNSKNISITSLKELLSRLLLIDYKIKTSDTNLKLEVDLFLAKATS
jgi:DNA polymerase III delta subunit